jgi:hypothetical protein
MAEDVREEVSQAAVATDATPEMSAAAEFVAPAETAPEAKAEPVIELKAEPASDAKSAPATIETVVSDAPVTEAGIPPAPQLDAAAAAAPPVFLREHEQRVPPWRPAAKAPPPKAPPVKAPTAKAPAEPKPKSRFTLLAATLALSAGLGAAAGAVGVPLAAQIASGPATAAAPTQASEAIGDVQAIKGAIAQLTTELGALRTSIEQSGKTTTTQIGKLSERIERSERAQAEPAAKLAKLGEAIERLERRAAAPTNDITGAIPKPVPAPPEAKAKPPIIEDYVVRKVFDGVALVEGRRGIIEVEPGMSLPGAGRIEEIRRQDGRWVVVTNKGLILSR